MALGGRDTWRDKHTVAGQGACAVWGVLCGEAGGRVQARRGQSLADAGEFGHSTSIGKRWRMSFEKRRVCAGLIRAGHRARTGRRGHGAARLQAQDSRSMGVGYWPDNLTVNLRRL